VRRVTRMTAHRGAADIKVSLERECSSGSCWNRW
jgi:hypothetical protein